MKAMSSVKPQDVAVVLKILSLGDQAWRQIDLANQLELSQGEIAKALGRLQSVGLISGKRLNRSACEEFLIHGVKYMFPQVLGPLEEGIPTAMSFPKHRQKLARTEDDIFVWPMLGGGVRGQMIQPLYKRFPEAARKDEKLYSLASAIEILRMGRAREREFAEKYIRQSMMES